MCPLDSHGLTWVCCALNSEDIAFCHIREGQGTDHGTPGGKWVGCLPHLSPGLH